MEKRALHTPDLAARNIERIAELFPTVITESRDPDGNVITAVDFDLLRQELSDYVVEGPQERYRLDWPGKRAAAFAANAPIAKTLRPVREESVDFDTSKNLFIEGDNLDALKLLQESYLGRVKLIYIDPPYNTGNDFVYEDDFAETSADYLGRSGQESESGDRLVANPESKGRFHSVWLSMMYPRLKLARSLLTDDGVIITAIGDQEQANLRLLLDQVFGAENFISDVVWQGGRKNDSRYVSNGADYMLIYAKNEVQLSELGVRWREPKVGIDAALAKASSIWSTRQCDDEASLQWKAWLKSKKTAGEITDSVARYDQLQSGTGRPMNTYGNITWPGRGGPTYTVLHPTTRKPVTPPKTGWRFQKEEMDRRIAAGQVWFGPDETAIPRGISFLDETNEQVAISVFEQDRKAASTDMRNLMGEIVFENPKDRRVLARWLRLVTGGTKDAVVLDFFAGSGSTGHAVMDLNAADGGHRRYILVQLDEAVDHPDYDTIASIARERLRRAGALVKQEAGLLDSSLDIGFRSLHVDSSNMADVRRTADETEQLGLDALQPSIRSGRSAEDLLFQVLLDWGLELSLPIVREAVDGREVFSVDDDALIACFAESVTPEVVRAIAARGPLRAVFRDDAFESDAARINAEQVFREVSPATAVRTI
ncbi:type III restriction-modification system methyltransferase [Microlunatus phosphovorus NM-1]|uniref:Type III restriction-modification system methyltransferase n=1 Tax=Microlunatus phosphovorus (strain ATCC 700054 / DSM 10555 / JCM 9379 / NBRC 101784 / NCIMB 13414 / VKM Ac-1990 / NM-1) TaxID=1032480 RepID=F5XNE7_MICPN|nr:site-specific DNA-methyltransferase [Microlunatus phosphovorus]BAK36597.1 type III restriction-modification system methyltransferase [Microlunatus phosphovorus NM-1]